MRKKGQIQFWGAAFLVVLLVLGIAWSAGKLDGLMPNTGSIGGNLPAGDNCGTAKTTTLTFNVQNVLNKTGAETFDVGYRFIGEGGNVVTGTDSTAGSVSLTCGETYTIKAISASGASGDSAEFVSVINGVATVSDGVATFKATEPAQGLTLGGMQHGVLELRAFDVLNNGYAYNGDNNALDYETDGASFTSTTNGTALAIGAGGEFHYKFEYRPSVADNVYGDIDGYYILVEAPTTTWNEPTVKVNGATLADIKDSLNEDEKKAYSSYEYVYHVPGGRIKQNSQDVLDVQMFALSGVDPSTDIEFDFAARGAYASTLNTNNIKIGSVADDSSQTVVHQLEDFTIDIS